MASGEGLSISLRNVVVSGHTAFDVSASVTASGVFLSGALSSKAIEFGDVTVQDAALQLSLWSSQRKKKVDLMIAGTLSVDILDYTVQCAVHLYPGQSGFEWAIVAELDSPKRPLSISDVVPEIKDSFLDFSLKSVVLIASSHDEPLLGSSYPRYTISKGKLWSPPYLSTPY